MPISLTRLQVVGPEPISLAETKLHLRVDFDDDDTLIESLITAARQYAEQLTGRTLVASQWQYNIDVFPYDFPVSGNISAPVRTTASGYVQCWVDAGTIRLPRSPIKAVDSIRYIPSEASDYVTLDSSQYVVDTSSEPARIAPISNHYWPTTLAVPNAVQITFTAGYGTVPQPIVTAIKLMIGNWYEQREDSKDIPKAAEYILSSYRVSPCGL